MSSPKRVRVIVCHLGTWHTLSKYTVDSLGNVRGAKGGILAASLNHAGYRAVTLQDYALGHRRNGSRSAATRRFDVHRIVCVAFNGKPTSNRIYARHIDGDKLNNRATNLEWGTPQDNARDAVRHREGRDFKLDEDASEDADEQQELF